MRTAAGCGGRRELRERRRGRVGGSRRSAARGVRWPTVGSARARRRAERDGAPSADPRSADPHHERVPAGGRRGHPPAGRAGTCIPVGDGPPPQPQASRADRVDQRPRRAGRQRGVAAAPRVSARLVRASWTDASSRLFGRRGADASWPMHSPIWRATSIRSWPSRLGPTGTPGTTPYQLDLDDASHPYGSATKNDSVPDTEAAHRERLSC